MERGGRRGYRMTKEWAVTTRAVTTFHILSHIKNIYIYISKLRPPAKPVASNQRHPRALHCQTSGILVPSKALTLDDPYRRTKSRFCITQNITTTDNMLFYSALHHLLCMALNGHTSYIQLLASVNSIHLFDFQFPEK